MADGMDAAAALEALVARKRAEQGIVLKDLPAAPPAELEPPDNGVAVERMLARTANAVASAKLEKRLQAQLTDRAPSMLAPAGPDLSLVDLVHRGHDGYIPLATKATGPWRELGCVPANVLKGLFGADWLLDELEVDAYFSLHGMFRPGYYRHRSTLPELAPSLRKAQHVRWLTTCHVDLDTYNVGMDAEAGVAAVLRAAREGLVPPPSMFSIARGCWAWWLLRDEGGRGPVRAWPSTVDRWSTLQGTLHQRLAPLGSDAAQLHAATCSRLPGSYATKAKRRVAWMACFDDEGKPFVYTLPELANALGIHLKPETVIEHETSGRPKDPSRIERGRRGYHSRWERYMVVLDQLRRMRGGWRVGTRAKALSLVAHGCRARGWDTPRCMEELARHLDGMEQPTGDQLKPAQLRSILKSQTKPKAGGVQWQTVADLLDVSLEESAVLSTARSRIPPARRHELLPVLKPVPPEERQRRRRDAIAAILKRREEEMGHFDPEWWVPTTRQLRDMLVAEGHAPASDRTLLKDLVALGRPSPRAHKPRPKPARQLQLPAPDGP